MVADGMTAVADGLGPNGVPSCPEWFVIVTSAVALYVAPTTGLGIVTWYG
jgi:hypothetical protein